MAFDGTEGDQISLQEASTMMQNYKNANPNSTHAQFMGKEIIGQILAQSGCVGIRSHFGINTNGVLQLVIVGVDANGNDMMSSASIIADRGVLSP